mgnify:FL=1
MRAQFFTTIASGATLSGNLDLTQLGGLYSIKAPANVTSGGLFIQGAISTTSADFARAQRAYPNSGDINMTLVGSLAAGTLLPMPDELRNQFAPYARLETTNAQIDTRTFVVLATRL